MMIFDMEANSIGNIVNLTIHFTTILEDPFKAKYRLNSIHLDPTLFTNEELKNLRSITIAAQTNGDAPDLEINSVFEFSVNTESRGYKRIVNAIKPGPPIKDEEFYSIQDQHMTLVYGTVKYIAWRNDVYINQSYAKVISHEMSWEFNGLCSVEQPKPQYEIGDLYELTQIYIFDFSKTNFKHFYKLYDAGLVVPLHQELLEEVRTLMYSLSRRSTYLMLYTTLEVATKTLIRTMRPDTDYLISKMQSPDLYKLYTEYINIEINELVSSEDAKTLKNMASVRNNLAHRGEGVNTNILQRHYEFVNALIKKIEVVIGYGPDN